MKKSAKSMHLSTLLQGMDQLWPRNCCICQRFVTEASSGGVLNDLCKYCTEQLVTLNCHISCPLTAAFFLCPLCGADQFVTQSTQTGCGCDPADLPFQHVVAPLRYAYPVNGLIHMFKNKKKGHWGRVLALCICDAAMAQGVIVPDAFVPVPSTRRKMCTRGFNPAEDIATYCGRHLHVPVRPNWVMRLEDTPDLKGLTRAERFTEIRGAFSVSHEVANQHIGIVDDVLTTGATSVELARELLDSGACAISLWVVARTAAN